MHVISVALCRAGVLLTSTTSVSDIRPIEDNSSGRLPTLSTSTQAPSVTPSPTTVCSNASRSALSSSPVAAVSSQQPARVNRSQPQQSDTGQHKE